jgi:hypothetical protein
MATRGNRPKSPYLKLVQGNPGRRAIQVQPRRKREKPLKPHHKLTRPQSALWKRFIEPAHWLTDLDVAKAYTWVLLQAAFEANPDEFHAAKLSHLRLLGSELGLDPTARARLGVTDDEAPDETDHYFE